MKKNKIKNIIICLFMFLMVLIIVVTFLLKREETLYPEISLPEVIKEPTTIEEVLEKYDSQYISKEKYRVYVKFGKDLYDDEGNSNKEYFYSIAEELKPYFEHNFILIDDEKNIKIQIDIENNKLIIKDMENFYEQTDGRDYSKVDDIKTVDMTSMHIESDELTDIVYEGMFVKDSTEQKLGKEDELQMQENYTSYQNGKIRLSKYEYSNRVRNIIFSSEYQNSIMSGISKNDTLKNILEKYPNPAFGSLKEGYLGYRTKDVYIFFHKDEVSVYGYSYTENTKIETYIKDYFETKDLALFKKRMVVTYDNFYEYTYDEQNLSLYLSYPSIGIEIDIKNNNPNGITLYKNYYYSDTMKEFVKEGLVKVEEDIDYLEKIEKQRISK